MKKTATVRATLDPEKKRQAGVILERLGMTHSQAINLFYSMIIEHNGLPFALRLTKTQDKKEMRVERETPTKTPKPLPPEVLAHLRESIRINRRLGESLP